MSIRKVAVLNLFDQGDEIQVTQSSTHVEKEGQRYLSLSATTTSGVCRLEEFEQWADEVKSLFEEEG